MGDKSPTQLIKEYKRALAHTKGEQYAKEIRVEYENGWFRVQHVDGSEKSYRKRQLVFFTEALSEEKLDPNAYDEAVRQRQQREANKFSTPAFDAEAYNRGVAERMAAAGRVRVLSRPQNSFAGCFLGLLALAFSVGVFWWIYADIEKRSKEAEVAREAKARAELEEWNRKWEAQRATLPSTPKLLPAADDREFKTVLGNIWPGVELYYRTDHRFYGVITDVRAGQVEVALAKTVSVDSRGMHGYAVWLDRSYVTQNFVTKRK
jgi:hypothetical protein